MINEAALAMEYGASCEDVARVCHAHPVSFFFFWCFWGKNSTFLTKNPKIIFQCRNKLFFIKIVGKSNVDLLVATY